MGENCSAYRVVTVVGKERRFWRTKAVIVLQRCQSRAGAMHFSIPETEELGDSRAKSYTGYSLHINGVYHCLVRYRQLHSLHEQLKREFHANTLPVFPPPRRSSWRTRCSTA